MIHYITTNGIGNPWVAAELRGMIDAGIPVTLHSMRDAGEHFFAARWARRLNAKTKLIYPLPLWRFVLASLLAPFRFRSRFFACLANSLLGERESSRARIASIAHVFVASYWATELAGLPVSLIHSQWIHSCGTIGMYGAWLLGVPFSFTGHAVDLFRDRVALRDKIARAEFIVCISEFHRALYLEYGAAPERLITVHCGIDVDSFEFRQRTRLAEPAHIITLGRLVEKKGNSYLVDACRILRDRGVRFRCTVAGDGPLTEPLRRQVEEDGLSGIVTVTGASLLQEELAGFMQSGDIYVQPCVWSSDNDVDGTPRTLMEAMACGVPSIATRIAGIPDIIEDRRSGLLVPPNSSAALADAIQQIVDDHALAELLSRCGRQKIERDFRLPDCLRPLEESFRLMLARGAYREAVEARSNARLDTRRRATIETGSR